VVSTPKESGALEEVAEEDAERLVVSLVDRRIANRNHALGLLPPRPRGVALWTSYSERCLISSSFGRATVGEEPKSLSFGVELRVALELQLKDGVEAEGGLGGGGEGRE
jgi:hypothetical protein